MNISGELIGLAAVTMPFLIPIVVILVKHQQKMAEIVQLNARNTVTPEVEMLRNDVQELKSLVAQQTINLDNLANLQAKMLETQANQAELSNRLRESA